MRLPTPANPSRLLCLAATAVVVALAAELPAQQPGNNPPVQVVPMFGPRFNPGGTDDAGSLPLFVFDRTAARVLRRAEGRIESGNYEDAVQLLQTIFDTQEDSVAPPGEAEDDAGATVRSLKSVADDLVAGLPPEGREVYELKYGVTARGQLAAAIADRDWDAVEEISRRYFHTAAGYDATYRLALRARDRNDPLTAASILSRLAATHAAANRFGTILTLREAAAWRTAGLPMQAEAAEDRLKGSGRPIVMAGASLSAAEAVRRIAGPATAAAIDGWPIVGRLPDRNGDAADAAPVGEPAWAADTLAADAWDRGPEADKLANLRRTLVEWESESAGGDVLRQPAFQPLIVGDLAVVRTFRDVTAFDLATGALRWKTERPNDSLYDWATGEMADAEVGGPQTSQHLLNLFAAQSAWQNVTAGSLSSDGRRIYGVEGVGMQSTALRATFPRGLQVPDQFWREDYDTLVAYDLAAEGRMQWSVGGPVGSDELGGTFFLGPPLPLGGRLYVLGEVAAEVRLLVLDPEAEAGRRLVWSQPLVGPEQGVRDDPARRLSGVAPTFAGGVLVCPTTAGAIMGIDIGRRHLLWGYQYPRKFSNAGGFGFPRAPAAIEDATGRWLDGIPIVAAGVVVVTPRDSDELHCLDLTTGRLLWKRPRGDGLYVAGIVDGKIVVVGRSAMRAFGAASGREAWPPIAIGEPAGRGIRSGDLYHLPLESGELLTVRLDTGRTLARSPTGGAAELGNLIAADGRVLSQSADSVVAFRPLAETEARARVALAAEPDAAEALALRGELRLYRGETREGLEDLRRAVGTADLPRAKRLLAAGLLNGLQTDFAAYRPFAEDLRRLATEPAARVEFLLVYGRGLLDAGESAAAFAEFAALCETAWSPPLERLADGRSVRADRLLRVRLGDIRRGLSESDREAVDALLRDRLAALGRRGDVGALRRFAELFGDTPAGDAALLALADLLSEAATAGEQEEVLLRVSESSDPATARTAIARLARFHPRAGPADGERFSASLRAEFIADQVGKGGTRSATAALEPVETVGPVPSAFSGWLFGLDPLARQLVARDPLGRERWRLMVVASEDEGPVLANPFGVTVKFSGRLAAIGFLDRLVVADLLSVPKPTVLWSRDLTERFGQYVIPPAPPRQVVLPGGRRRLVLRDAAGRPLSSFGFAGAGLLLSQVGAEVTAADPRTGGVRWIREAMPRGCTLTGDRDFVILQPSNSTEAMILRTADGADVPDRPLRRSAEPAERLAWLGCRLVTWRAAESGGRRLSCRDVARDAEVWSRSYPEGTRCEAIDGSELAMLDPSGRLDAVRLADGSAVTMETGLRSGVEHFLTLRSADRYFVFTQVRPTVPGPAVQENPFWAHADGPTFAFDRTDGRTLWTTTVERQQVDVEQPLGLPVVLLTAEHRPVGGNGYHELQLLDLRTGETRLVQKRLRQFSPFRSAADGAGGVAVVLPGARIAVTPASDGR